MLGWWFFEFYKIFPHFKQNKNVETEAKTAINTNSSKGQEARNKFSENVSYQTKGEQKLTWFSLPSEILLEFYRRIENSAEGITGD